MLRPLLRRAQRGVRQRRLGDADGASRRRPLDGRASSPTPRRGERGRLTPPCRSWTSRRRARPARQGRPRSPLPSAWMCTATWTSRVPRCRPRGRPASDVPDVLAPNLRCVFCGINPGRVSAAAHAHFANPRNDFWRLLHDAGFTPRLFEPEEQFELLELGLGVTNAAYRTTPGSGDLRRGDFDAAALEQMARELRPHAIAFVGKEAYRGAVRRAPRARPADAGRSTTPRSSSSRPPRRRTPPFRTPSGCAGSARCTTGSSRAERAGRARAPRRRRAPGAPDAAGEIARDEWWIYPGRRRPGGRDRRGRRSGASCSRRRACRPRARRRESTSATHVLPRRRLAATSTTASTSSASTRSRSPTIDLEAENVTGHRWWTIDELERTERALLAAGAARAPARRYLAWPWRSSSSSTCSPRWSGSAARSRSSSPASLRSGCSRASRAAAR